MSLKESELEASLARAFGSKMLKISKYPELSSLTWL